MSKAPARSASTNGGNVVASLVRMAKRNGELQATNPADEIRLISAALADLEGEKAAALAAINDLGAQRDALLFDIEADEKLADLDNQVERHQRQIERLDALRPLLHAQLLNRENAHRQEHFNAIVRRYQQEVSEYCDLMRRALAVRRTISALRGAAQMGGFRQADLLFEIPYLQTADPDRFEYAVASNFEWTKQTVPPALISIRFKERCGIYMTGDIAGFDAETARAYLNFGAAELVSA
jgi:hypothetical protein